MHSKNVSFPNYCVAQYGHRTILEVISGNIFMKYWYIDSYDIVNVSNLINDKKMSQND